MDNYIKLELIGRGGNGNKVYLVKDLNTGVKYALKRIHLDFTEAKEKEKNENEIEIFKSLNHPNLIQYITSFYDKKKRLCIIMEYADNGDLYSIVKNHRQTKKHINEDLIWKFVLQIFQGIKYIHSKKIIHRDIKCQNIFLTNNGTIKIGDFGISRLLKNTVDDFAKTPIGTPYFLSPEICSGSKYNFKIDMWMIGCVLYELATLRKPFEAPSIPELVEKIKNQDFIPISKIYSNELQFLIEKLLNKDPLNRPSIKEVLNFDFIVNKMKKYGFTQVYDEKWNECPNYVTEGELKKSPTYTLFNLKMDNLNQYQENNIKEEDEKKINVLESKNSIISTIEDKNFFQDELKNHINVTNKKSGKNNNIIELNFEETMNSTTEMNKKQTTPFEVIKGKLSIQYDFLVTKLGKENMEKFIKLIENKKKDINNINDDIKNIFGEDINEKNITKLKSLAKKIVKECYS
jgi:serine/threonine protein kinase